MEWSKPKKHPQECFFCQTVVPPGCNKTKEGLIRYAFNVPSVKKVEFVAETNAGSETEDDADADAEGGADADAEGGADASAEGGAQGGADYDDMGFDAAADIGEDEPMDIAEELNVGASTSSGAFKAPFNLRSSTMSYASVTSNVSSGSEFHAPRHYSDLQPPKAMKNVIELTQERMNDIVRDMNLTKENAEFLASRFKDLGLGDGK